MKIDIKITEAELIEHFLNIKEQYGLNNQAVIFTLSIIALKDHWKYDKLLYYFDLLGVKEE